MTDLRTFTRAFDKLVNPIRRKVNLMVGRAVLSAIDDSKKVQVVKLTLLDGEESAEIERFQEYGFTSTPFDDCEAIVVFVGGNRSHGVVIATEDRAKRPTAVAEGDTALYNSNGVRVLLDDSGDEVLLGNAPTVFASLSDLVDARLTSIQSTFDTHTHITTATIGPSAAPGTIAPPSSPIGPLDTVAATEVKIK